MKNLMRLHLEKRTYMQTQITEIVSINNEKVVEIYQSLLWTKIKNK